MRNIGTVIKKEFARFFGDKRLLFTSCIMPGLMIYVIYSIMGGAISTMINCDADYVPQAYVAYMPDSVRNFFEGEGVILESVAPSDAEAIISRIADKDADICVVFPEKFERETADYDVLAANGKPAPNVEVYYNSSSPPSSDMYGKVMAALDGYEKSIANKFDVNRPEGEAGGGYDLATDKDVSGRVLSSVLPLLLIIFLYSGCLAIAPESIAGEKERGTIATLLVTPIKRSELAIGKIISITVIALLCGLSSSLGTLLSMPKLLGAGGTGELGIQAFYAPRDYALLVIVILSTILVIISLISLTSAYAKTVREASLIASPLMLAVMLAGVSGMFGTESRAAYYLIPIYNSVHSMRGILAFDYLPLNAATTALSNLGYALAGGFALARMFDSERIVFTR
ncbi:MAG: ABC transporter permease subunit [Clostridiales Family XIII bacterium]|nr:ABC transporter permease subunit [Clostridiales Family XIII bacterium]